MATHSVPKISEEEYLRLERAAEYKSEFVSGEIFAMSGGSKIHSMLALHFGASLRQQLRGGECKVYTSDLRVRTPKSGAYFYPDLSVACGPTTPQDDQLDVLTDPIVIVEVLSPSTADYDQGRKFELYREICSLSDYVLVHTAKQHVEHFTRQGEFRWILREYAELEMNIRLESVGCTVQLADIFSKGFMATQSVPKISEEEYLQQERTAECKSEYVHGEIFAMSGGSPRHALAAIRFAAALDAQLRGGRCLPFGSDLKIRSSRTHSYLYPDLSVICGKLEMHPGTMDVATNPVLLVEVLSPSTEAYDRGKKFELYREISSLQDYVLVHTAGPHVEHFMREDDASWIYREYKGLESSISFQSLGCSVSLANVFEGMFSLPE